MRYKVTLSLYIYICVCVCVYMYVCMNEYVHVNSTGNLLNNALNYNALVFALESLLVLPRCIFQDLSALHSLKKVLPLTLLVFGISALKSKQHRLHVFSYSAAETWNFVPVSVRHSQSFSALNSSPKIFLFKQYLNG